MALYELIPVQVQAVKWSPGVLPNEVGPYQLSVDEDGDQINDICPICNNGMNSHGVLLNVNVGRIVCPNAWLVQSEGRVEMLRPKAFQRKYRPVT